MHPLRPFLAALLVAGTLVAGLPPISRARPAAATALTTAYLTTAPAYDAWTPGHAVQPPKVTVFPAEVADIAIYYEYTGARAHQTAVRVDFTHGSRVLHQEKHTPPYSDGSTIVKAPVQGQLSAGSYEARFYVDGKLARTVGFSVINVPKIVDGYMISAKAWDQFDPNGTASPPRSRRIRGKIGKAAVFFSYQGAVRGASYFAVVYDKYGKEVHHTATHPLSGVPDGRAVLLLSATGGHFAPGPYRTDIYINGAMVDSIPWRAI